jgi:5-formyltetrahydrofolate cyclo-ligase
MPSAPPSEDQKTAKLHLRSHAKERLRSWTFSQAASRALCESVRAQPAFQNAENIGLFAPRPWEPDLRLLFETRPLACVYPRVFPQAKRMEFFRIGHFGELTSGFGGILEPPIGDLVSFGPGDLLLVPALCFDRLGNRIGSGAGYYDRFLSQTPGVERWGVTAEALLAETELAQEPADVKMQAVFTEVQVYWANAKSG